MRKTLLAAIGLALSCGQPPAPPAPQPVAQQLRPPTGLCQEGRVYLPSHAEHLYPVTVLNDVFETPRNLQTIVVRGEHATGLFVPGWAVEYRSETGEYKESVGLLSLSEAEQASLEEPLRSIFNDYAKSEGFPGSLDYIWFNCP